MFFRYMNEIIILGMKIFKYPSHQDIMISLINVIEID